MFLHAISGDSETYISRVSIYLFYFSVRPPSKPAGTTYYSLHIFIQGSSFFITHNLFITVFTWSQKSPLRLKAPANPRPLSRTTFSVSESVSFGELSWAALMMVWSTRDSFTADQGRSMRIGINCIKRTSVYYCRVNKDPVFVCIQ